MRSSNPYMLRTSTDAALSTTTPQNLGDGRVVARFRDAINDPAARLSIAAARDLETIRDVFVLVSCREGANDKVRLRSLLNPHLPKELLDETLPDENSLMRLIRLSPLRPTVRFGAVPNPNIDMDTLIKIHRGDSDDRVRWMAKQVRQTALDEIPRPTMSDYFERVVRLPHPKWINNLRAELKPWSSDGLPVF